MRIQLRYKSGIIQHMSGRLDEAYAAYAATETLCEKPTLHRWDYMIVSQCRLYFIMSTFLNRMSAIEASDWARDKSARLVAIVELAPPALDPEARNPHADMRDSFRMFHARWLAYCAGSGPEGLDEIPHILAALQGRNIAARLFDELDSAGDDGPRPEAVRAYQGLRRQLRALAAEIEGLVAGGWGGASAPASPAPAGSPARSAESCRRSGERR